MASKIRKLNYSIILLSILLSVQIITLVHYEYDITIIKINILLFITLYIFHNIYEIEPHPYWSEIKKLFHFYSKFIAIIFVINYALEQDFTLYLLNVMQVFFLFIITLSLSLFFRNNKNYRKRILIIGTGYMANEVREKIENTNFTTYDIAGFVDIRDNTLIDLKTQKTYIEHLDVRCKLDDLGEYLDNNKINEVIIAIPNATNKDIYLINRILVGKVDVIKTVPKVNNVMTFNSYVQDIDGLLFISTTQNQLILRKRIIKRIFDITFALTGLFVFGIFYLILGFTIKLEDGGNILYTHKRVGKNLKEFNMYKFRSMYTDAEEKLTEILDKNEEIRNEYYKNFKLKDDPRITKVGNFIRKTSLDELPQFINVLKGEMSVVGPRPVVDKEIQMYYKESSMPIFSVKPGITGMWQVTGRSDVDNYDERISLDMYYTYNWSLWLDIIIIIRTIKSVLNKSGAY